MRGIGGSFSGTVKPIASLPMVISCGRLGSRWFDSAGRFVFCFFWGKSAFWGGAAPPVARDLGGFGKALDGPPLLGPGGGLQPQMPRSWRGKPPVLRVQFGRSGALFWAYGQVRADARDVNQR